MPTETKDAAASANAAGETLSMEGTHTHVPRVVILGGGVAGLTAAYELRRRLDDCATVTLVSDSELFSLGPAIVWVPFSRRLWTGHFLLSRSLERRGIHYVHASATHVDPARNTVQVAQLGHHTEISYDYLVIATGPRADATIPGLAGASNATSSIWNEPAALDARMALECFLEQPGPVVVGTAPGAQYLSAAYEFALLLDHELRRQGKREQAPITFITAEPYLGYLDIGAPTARNTLTRLFARRSITAITGTAIERVDREGVQLQGGQTLPAAYTMIIPPFTGVSDIWKVAGLTDARGFVPVDAQYRHTHYPNIYAVGMAAEATATPSALQRLPRTGYLATAMARAAARNVATAITGQAPARRSLPRLLDVRLLDGGDGGILLLTALLGGPLHLVVPLPGRTAHWAKQLLVRYVLWKLRTGRTNLP